MWLNYSSHLKTTANTCKILKHRKAKGGSEEENRYCTGIMKTLGLLKTSNRKLRQPCAVLLLCQRGASAHSTKKVSGACCPWYIARIRKESGTARSIEHGPKEILRYSRRGGEARLAACVHCLRTFQYRDGTGMLEG